MSFLSRALMRSVAASKLAGSLSGTVNTAASVTLDAITGVTAYRCHNGSNSQVGTDQATLVPGAEITAWSFYGTTPVDGNTLPSSVTLSWTGATGGNGTIPAGNNSGVMRWATCGTTEMGVQATVKADTTLRKVRVYCRTLTVGGNSGISCRATLSDGSATAVVKTQSSATTSTYFEFAYNAGSAGKTLLIQLFPATLGSGSAIGYGAITYGT